MGRGVGSDDQNIRDVRVRHDVVLRVLEAAAFADHIVAVATAFVLAAVESDDGPLADDIVRVFHQLREVRIDEVHVRQIVAVRCSFVVLDHHPLRVISHVEASGNRVERDDVRVAVVVTIIRVRSVVAIHIVVRRVGRAAIVISVAIIVTGVVVPGGRTVVIVIVVRVRRGVVIV